MVKRICKDSNIPMVFMIYANVVLSYKMVEGNMSGLILPDVPYEGKGEFDVVLKKYELDLISMIVPTSHQRIQTIAKDAGGFISTPEQAKKMADQSDGAIEKIVEKYGKDAHKYVEEYVKEMVEAIK